MPVRMTDAQFALFQSNQRSPSAVAKKGKGQRAKKLKANLPENQVEEQVKSFLVSRGWVVTRNHVGRFIPLYVVMQASESNSVLRVNQLGGRILTIGVKGQADYTATRARPSLGFGIHQRIHIELKAKGNKPRPEQIVWMRDRNILGEPAVWFDEFEGAGERSFIAWYKRVIGD